MSRSYRKIPIMGNTSSYSNKKYKQYEHRAERSKIKILLHKGFDLLPHPKEYGNEWSSPRDGKSYFGQCKDQKYYSKWLRK